jgi:DNA mismatch repair protein MutS
MTIIHEYLFYQEKYQKKYGHDKTLVLMQVGSFHEAYSTKTRGCNLSIISELLNIIMTRKDKKVEIVDEKNPYMLGFPTVSLNKFLRVLINNGYTIIVIDQTTPPPDPKREITGIYSPGTYIEEALTPDSNNIICLYIENELQMNHTNLLCVGMSSVDLSTGEMNIHEAHAINGDDKLSLDEALRFIISTKPKEIILYAINQKDNIDNILQYLEINDRFIHKFDKIDKNYKKISYINTFLKKIYKNTGILSPIEYLNMEKKPYAIISMIALLNFAYQHNEHIIENLNIPKIFSNSTHLMLGNNAIFQLNVFESNNNDDYSTKFKCLFDVINNTSTAIGRRYLKNILANPLISHTTLNTSYSNIESIITDAFYTKIEGYLKSILDLVRLCRKISLGMIDPHEFVGFYESLSNVKELYDLLMINNKLINLIPNKQILDNLDKFIEEFNNTFIIDEMKKYSRKDIQTSIFKQNIYPEIDKLQNEINDNINFMDILCGVLSTYIDGSSKSTKSTKSEQIY